MEYLWQIVKLTRLPIVAAVIPIFLLGVLFALQIGAEFSFFNFLIGFSILLLIEVGASFANDYFDFDADKFNKQFGFSGGSGVLLHYPELRLFAKWASIVLFLFALILTSLFTWYASFPLWTIGYIIIAIFFCWFYTAPPLRLVYRGLGELPHFLAGIMFPGWGYLLMTKTIDTSLLIFAIPFGLLGLTVILNFEIPDREADIHAGKQNFIVRKGRFLSFIIIMMLYILTTLYFTILALTNWYSPYISFNAFIIILLLPTSFSISAVLKNQNTQRSSTKYALRNAITGFLAVFFIMCLLLI